MVKRIPEVELELERRVEALAMEVVELEWAGSERRPILRLRVDFPGSEPGSGVTVGDCARVSRELEPWLDEHEALSERYVLEVSSPGVERPVSRKRDWVRFVGREVAVKGAEPLGNGGSRRLEGEILRVEEEDAEAEEFRVYLGLNDGTEVEISQGEIERAHLIYRWE